MGFDWFDTRYFSGAQGRFNSPDQPFAGQHPEDPQSWNLYAYALNNPLRFVDPNGRCTELLTRAARRAQAWCTNWVAPAMKLCCTPSRAGSMGATGREDRGIRIDVQQVPKAFKKGCW